MIHRIDIKYSNLPANVPFVFDGRSLQLHFEKNERTGGVTVQIWEKAEMIYTAPLQYGYPVMHVVMDTDLPKLTVLRPEDFEDGSSLQDIQVSADTLGQSVFIYISDEAA